MSDYLNYTLGAALEICQRKFLPMPQMPKHLNDESVTQYEADFDNAYSHNKELQEQIGAVLGECQKIVRAAYGEARLSGAKKGAVWGSGIPFVPYDRGHARRAYEAQEKKASLAIAEKERAEELELLRLKAIEYLIAEGKRAGIDFTLGTAPGVALELAAQKLIAKKIEQVRDTGALMPFNGFNCDGPCEGWDGESRRCQCGNRRVSWDWTGPFDAPRVFGEAY